MMNLKEMQRRGVVLVLALIVGLALLCCQTTIVNAASAKVTINAESLRVGENTTVKVVYSGDNIGRVKSNLTYDNSVISYTGGGDSEGDNGLVSINRAGTGGDIVVDLQFTGKAPGNANIQIETIEAYNLDEQPMDVANASKSISVVSAEVVDDDEEQVEEKKDEEKKEPEVIASKDEPEEEDGGNMGLVIGIFAAALVLAIIIGILVRKRKRR